MTLLMMKMVYVYVRTVHMCVCACTMRPVWRLGDNFGHRSSPSMLAAARSLCCSLPCECLRIILTLSPTWIICLRYLGGALCGSWDLNSGLCAYVAITLPTGLSFQSSHRVFFPMILKWPILYLSKIKLLSHHESLPESLTDNFNMHRHTKLRSVHI